MYRSTILPATPACAMRGCVEYLADIANRYADDQHPRVDYIQFTPSAQELPSYIVLGSRQFYALYSSEDGPHTRLSEPLLWIAVKPTGGCSGGSCRHQCSGDLEVHVWQSPRFALSCEEVNCLIVTWCGLTDHPWLHQPRGWAKLRAICAAAAAAAAQEWLCIPPAAQRRRRGAGLLTSTRLLEEAMAELPDIYNYAHLYEAWLAWYTTAQGRSPRDSYKSFNAAAHGCIERILRRRT